MRKSMCLDLKDETCVWFITNADGSKSIEVEMANDRGGICSVEADLDEDTINQLIEVLKAKR